MDSTILAETQAFITKQREALLQQRETIFGQQHELQRQLDEVNLREKSRRRGVRHRPVGRRERGAAQNARSC